MGLIKRSVTINSGTTNPNIIAGELFRTLQRPAAVRLLAAQRIVLLSNLEIDFNVGNVIAGNALVPNHSVTAGVVDRSVDAFPAVVGSPQDEIQLRVRETTGIAGANGILDFILEITELM